jgi:hypothetical protein
MSIFEFSSIIVAIVVGLAIANVLDKFSHTIKVTNWIKQGWFQSLLCVLVLNMMLGYFWGFWGMFYSATQIGLLEFVLGPFISITSLYLISVFLPVPRLNENSTDIDDYFMKGRKPFFILITIFIVQSQLTALYYPHIAPSLLVLLTLPFLFLGVLLKTIRTQKIIIIGAAALIGLIVSSAFIAQT